MLLIIDSYKTFHIYECKKSFEMEMQILFKKKKFEEHVIYDYAVVI